MILRYVKVKLRFRRSGTTKFLFSEPIEALEISDFHQFLTNFSFSGGPRKLYMGDMITFKVFKRLPLIRAFQRTLYHYIAIRRSEATRPKKRNDQCFVFRAS